MANYCSQLAEAPAFWEVQIPAPIGYCTGVYVYYYCSPYFQGTYLIPWLSDCVWAYTTNYSQIIVQFSSGELTVSFPQLAAPSSIAYSASGVTGNFSGNLNLVGTLPGGITAPQSITVTAVPAPCSPPPSPPPSPNPSPNPSNNPSNNPPPPCYGPPVSPPVPCLTPIQQSIQWRPPFYCNTPPTVMDPVYGEVMLTPCPPPLRCYKSHPLPDGSTWMWLGEPRHRSRLSSLAGMLFFATSWECWKKLEFVSTVESQGTSVWQGQVGNGRVCGLEVEVTQAVWPNPQ